MEQAIVHGLIEAEAHGEFKGKIVDGFGQVIGAIAVVHAYAIAYKHISQNVVYLQPRFVIHLVISA